MTDLTSEPDPGTTRPPGRRPSFWRRLRDWASWEFDRRIDVTLAIRLITIERFAKAAILLIGGVVLLVLGAKTDAHHIADWLQDQLNLSPGSSWWGHLYSTALKRLGGLSRSSEHVIAAGAILYGALEALEGVGLILRRRWAEYLVLIATAAFLPLEVVEMIHKPTVFKAGALAVNILIIAYLIWRKRLFLERPSAEQADETSPVPASLQR